MGYKEVKRHYRIGHAVTVTKQGICVGSPYIHNLIVIGLDGQIKKRDSFKGNDDLQRYLSEMDADPEKLKQLIQLPDTFTDSIPVFTYEGGRIIEKMCEQPGWPNTTHDGEMMYENTFSTDKAKVVKWAKQNATLEVEFWKEKIEDLRSEVAKAEALLSTAEADHRKLESDYP